MIQSKQKIPRWIIRESEKNAHVKINLELESKISLICKYNIVCLSVCSYKSRTIIVDVIRKVSWLIKPVSDFFSPIQKGNILAEIA